MSVTTKAKKQKKETAEKYTSERRWGTKGAGDSQFNNPYSLATDLLGNVYITDTGNNWVEKFSTVETTLKHPYLSYYLLMKTKERNCYKICSDDKVRKWPRLH